MQQDIQDNMHAYDVVKGNEQDRSWCEIFRFGAEEKRVPSIVYKCYTSM